MNISDFGAELVQKLRTLSHISLIAHKNPDGDAFGSLEGMRQLILANLPNLTVDVVVPKSPVIERAPPMSALPPTFNPSVTDIP